MENVWGLKGKAYSFILGNWEEKSFTKQVSIWVLKNKSQFIVNFIKGISSYKNPEADI